MFETILAFMFPFAYLFYLLVKKPRQDYEKVHHAEPMGLRTTGYWAMDSEICCFTQNHKDGDGFNCFCLNNNKIINPIYQIYPLDKREFLQTIEEENNPLMCVDYSYDGMLFATGGNDKYVRLYDDNTKTLIKKLERHRYDLPEHSNRIFAVKFSKKDNNLLLSGGWDNTILLYDIRAREVQNYLYGPHICGDGMDLKDDLLLTVSWDKEDQIQMFDLRMNKKIGVFQMNIIEDRENKNALDNVSYLYSCRFNPQNKTFCVTGSNKNYLRIYDYNNLNSDNITEKRIKRIRDLDDLILPCYCCDYNLKGNKLVYGSAKSKIDFLDLK